MTAGELAHPNLCQGEELAALTVSTQLCQQVQQATGQAAPAGGGEGVKSPGCCPACCSKPLEVGGQEDEHIHSVDLDRNELHVYTVGREN